MKQKSTRLTVKNLVLKKYIKFLIYERQPNQVQPQFLGDSILFHPYLLRGYDLRQSTHLKLIPSCLAGRVIGLGTSGLLASEYFCPTIIGKKQEATDAKWHWMDCSISYILCQLRLIHSRSINIRKSTAVTT